MLRPTPSNFHPTYEVCLWTAGCILKISTGGDPSIASSSLYLPPAPFLYFYLLVPSSPTQHPPIAKPIQLFPGETQSWYPRTIYISIPIHTYHPRSHCFAVGRLPIYGCGLSVQLADWPPAPDLVICLWKIFGTSFGSSGSFGTDRRRNMMRKLTMKLCRWMRKQWSQYGGF